MADESFDPGGSPLYARLAREYADDPVIAEISAVERQPWNLPMLVLAGVHLLALRGEEVDPWSRFGDVIREHKEFLARFVAEQNVQTNEVQRSFAFLPAFLTVADERPLDLIELGPSAGLNLLWDRYRYEYATGAWGDPEAPVALSGEAAPPAELLERRPVVRSRYGIDRSPIDVTNEDEALLLQSFVWADQTARLERLRRAIDVARLDPPRLVQGDYRDELPRLLAERPADGLTVVFHSVSLAYVRREERLLVQAQIEAVGREGPLAWVSYEFDESSDRPAFEAAALDVTVWPGGEKRRLALLDGHANRMRWVA